MLELLRNIPEMEVYGDDPTDQLVRMSRSQPSRVDMHPAVDSANSTLPPVETVRERAVEIVQRAQSAGEKILAHVVAKELGKAFNDNKTLISQLGYESSLQFLTETPGLEVYTEDANKRYVRLRNTEEPLKQDMLNVSSG